MNLPKANGAVSRAVSSPDLVLRPTRSTLTARMPPATRLNGAPVVVARRNRLVVLRERDELGFAPAAGGDDDELPTGPHTVGHRIPIHRKPRRATPDLRTRRLVERIQVRRAAAEEHEAAPGHHGARVAASAEPFSQLDAAQQRMIAQFGAALAERHLPSDLARIEIDRH